MTEQIRVPGLSMAFMAVTCVIAFAIPIVLFIVLRRKKKADIAPFFVGCAVMLVFALILEAAVNRAVLGSGVGQAIRGNLWLYALYGGWMAGLFEETGRFVAFRTVLKKRQDKDVNALMYGAGHGGLEAAGLVGIAMINNLVYSAMINAGNTAAITGSLTGDTLAQMEAAITTLTTTPSYQFLLSGVERISAVAMQIALSVLVWFAVKKQGKGWLYPLAILLHFLVDAVMVLLSGHGVPLAGVEAAIALMAAAVVLVAVRVWKDNAGKAEENALDGAF